MGGDMTSWLRGHRVLVCAGTGGVGKTTLAASLGCLAAKNGQRALVLTIDPAQRLAQALGIAARPGEETPVPGLPGLTAAMIQPRLEFDQFVLGSVDNVIAKGLFNNKLYQQLVTNLSGSQEFTSLVRLMNSLNSGKYDVVILDTPPTQNAVDFLRAPDHIYALFQDSVIGWFSGANENQGLVRRAFHRSTHLVMMALERVTGSTFIHELKDFFEHVSHLRSKVAHVSQEARQLLHSPQCAFILVTGFDETKMKEAVEFQAEMSREGLGLGGVVVNRWFPQWIENERSWPTAWATNPDFALLREFHTEFAGFFQHRQSAFEGLVRSLGVHVPVIRLPDFKNTVVGIEDLSLVAAHIEERWRSET
jgi:anion-transporting  ArsA/GET3 family ATPase